jgi:hypothetical protein
LLQAQMPLLISDYLMQMAERVYGDAAATEREHGAATLARWIFRERPTELNVRRLQREEQLLGRRSAEQIRHAAGVLVEVTLHNERFRPFGVLPDWPPWRMTSLASARRERGLGRALLDTQTNSRHTVACRAGFGDALQQRQKSPCPPATQGRCP